MSADQPLRQAFMGTLRLTRLQLRTSRRALVLIPLALAGLVNALGSAQRSLYPDLAQRVAYARSMGASTATIAINGRGYDLTTLGGITAFELGFMGLLLLPVAGGALALRLRADEDSGRADLLTAGPVGVLAPLGASAVTTLLAAGLLAVTAAGGLAAQGFPMAGSLRFGGALALFMLAWAAVMGVVGQLAGSRRMAWLLGLLVVLVTFLVRAVVDGKGWAATGVSPMSWLAEVRPWGDGQRWPVVALLGLTAVSFVVAGGVARRRDLGSGVVQPRPGPAVASPRLISPVGLAWRLTAGPALGIAAGLAAWGMVLGLLTSEMVPLVAANPSILEALGLRRPEELVTVLGHTINALGATAVAVVGVRRLSGEETAGRLGLLLSAPLRPGRVVTGWLLVTAAECLFALGVGGLALGTGAWISGDQQTIREALPVTAAYAVPVVVVAAGCALAQAIRPSMSSLGWLVFGWAAVVAMLAQGLDLPEWARDLSPLHAIGTPPSDLVPGWLVGFGVATVLAVVLGHRFFTRRDLVAG